VSEPMLDILKALAHGVGNMTYGDPDDADAVNAADVIRWAAAEIERLREYAISDARCPCCDNAERCVDDCTFAADCPVEARRMAAARTALGVEVRQ
jgi:hypothetical protein